MTKPAVSVLISTHNHERYIEQAIVSVLEQNFPRAETEVLVVDDGSTDRTAGIVQKFELRVRLVRKSNGGQASAYNTGIGQARGRVVAFLDGDDWWAPGKLTAAMEALEANPGLGAVGHGYYRVEEDGTTIATVSLKSACQADLSSAESARFALAICEFLGGSMLCVRAESLRRMGPIPEELIFSADVPVFHAALALGGVRALEKPLCYYRLHGQNLFAFRSEDPSKIRRRNQIVEILVRTTPPLLRKLGVSEHTVRAVTQHWSLRRQADQFKVVPPGRLRFFWHLCKCSWYFRKQMSWRHKAVNFLNAVGSLIVGYKDYPRLDEARIAIKKRILSSLRRHAPPSP